MEEQGFLAMTLMVEGGEGFPFPSESAGA